MYLWIVLFILWTTVTRWILYVITSLPGVFPESSPVRLLVKAHYFWNFFSSCLQFIEVIQHWHATGPSSNHTNTLELRHLWVSVLFSCKKYAIDLVRKRRARGRNQHESWEHPLLWTANKRTSPEKELYGPIAAALNFIMLERPSHLKFNSCRRIRFILTKKSGKKSVTLSQRTKRVVTWHRQPLQRIRGEGLPSDTLINCSLMGYVCIGVYNIQ